MQKIILDTNVLVSSIISRSYPQFIVKELFIEQKVMLCISENINLEYNRVLIRPKFLKYSDYQREAERLIELIDSYALVYFPTANLNIIIDDSDNKFIELADECNADFLITGNKNDFTFSQYKNTKIVSPKEYWDNYKPI
jgi:putative PIN family toxin of toxin-antitoxin system